MGAEPAGSTGADDGDDDGLPISRGTLVRILIVVAIGIPIVVEGVTFVGLVGHQLTDGGDTGDGPTAPRGVGVGDDLLPATNQSETLRSAAVDTTQGWRFRLAVDVANADATGYSFTVVSVTTGAGTTIETPQSTGAVPPGRSTRLEAAWDLPSGETPARVTVEATIPTETGVRTERATVALESVAVRG